MHAARTDKNQAVIVAALREVGCGVVDTSRIGRGFPDLIVIRDGHGVFLIEVKSEKGKLNPRQERWHAEWKGQVSVVHSVEEAFRVVGIEC